MDVNVDTRFVTLLGTPLGQSFAARMQNAAYAAAGLNLLYTYTEVGQQDLPFVVEGLRHMPNVAGFAVTRPNKIAVMPLLDELDELCERMGACNTVVRTPEGRLVGYNTDAPGFLRALEETKVPVRRRTFFCLGAGGFGRAMCAALAMAGAGRIFVCDVVPEAAEELVTLVNEHFAPVAQVVQHRDWSSLPLADAVVNATGIGMGKTAGQSPLPAELVDPTQLYIDACYNPARTQFLRDAEAAGAQVMNGLEMSLWQGAAQIELWAGVEAPVDVMRRELELIVAGW